MSDQLRGKVALITGGTSGIGEATAQRFVAEGARVVITGRSREKGAGIVERLGDRAAYVHADVTREADIAASVDAALARFGKLDILFNNAGGPLQTTIQTINQDQIDHGVHLLFSSVLLGMRYAVPPMKANGGGVIINNASIAGIRYGQGDLLYSAMKAAITHYSKLAAVELGPDGIRVNVISPGAIATPFFWGGSERANTISDDENARKMTKLQGNLARAQPVASSGLSEHIADALLFLASDAGRFVNAHDLVVDGGRTALFNE